MRCSGTLEPDLPGDNEHYRSGVAGAENLDLDRDLRLAVSEFAPGAGVVAGKQAWISAGVRVYPDKRLEERAYQVCNHCQRFFFTGAAKVCPQCGERVSTSDKMIIPKYGFVATSAGNKRLGEARPPRLYSSRTYFADFEGGETPGGRARRFDTPVGPVSGRFARHGRLAVVNQGKGAGFWYCPECGHAEVRKGQRLKRSHEHPVRRSYQCHHALEPVHIGHTFPTDMAEFEIPLPGIPSDGSLASIQSAITEGAARYLQLRRADIDGTYYYDVDRPIFVVYDTVPGGAGLARRAFGAAREVLQTAYELAADCQCGEHSSCYRCLRNYGNQRLHDALDRTVAANALGRIVG